ncbi:transposable element Tcb1 transposase [Trichonephila clavipes]|nr:transposable element Tcb1 transposase [Trichonephila clavipes]
MAFSDRAAPSRALSRELGSFARPKVSTQTVQRCLPQHGPSARGPWQRLPLTLHHRQERLQWCDQRRTWTPKCPDVIFLDESRFSLQHQDCRIRVWWHRGERTLAVRILHRHRYLSSDMLTVLDTENVLLLPWPAHSPDLSPIVNVWSMVVKRLARQHTSVNTVDEWGHHMCVEAA